MSCFDNASPVWVPGFMPENYTGAFDKLIYSEDFMDGLPAAVIDSGYTCAQAKQVFLDLFASAAQYGNLAVAKNGATVGSYAESIISGEAQTIVSVMNEIQMNNTEYPAGTDPWPATVAGVDFGTRQFYYNRNTMSLGIPVTLVLQSFDFDAWWDCASGCRVQRPTPRMGMQTLSNFTYSVINSFGQVPKI